MSESLQEHARRLHELSEEFKYYKPHLERLAAQPANASWLQHHDRSSDRRPPLISEESQGHDDMVLDRKSPGFGDLALPIGHTTAAHKLLRWESIKKLTGDVNEDYVFEIEEKRGLIRIYGRSEGSDKDDGGFPVSTPTISDEFDEPTNVASPIGGPSPASSEGPWGSGFFGVQSYEGKGLSSEIGGLNTDGTMQLDHATVERLYQSYLDHIHIMHPFLDKKVLKTMVWRLIARSGSALPRRVVERKRADDLPDGQSKSMHDSSLLVNRSEATSTVRTMPERNVSNAIGLLVLALGKTCEWKIPLPGTAPDPKSPPSVALSKTVLLQPPRCSNSPSMMQTDSPAGLSNASLHPPAPQS